MSGAAGFDYMVDIASTIDQEETGKTAIKDLVAKEYDYLAPYIDGLFFVEANIVFLNYVSGVSQTVISDIFNIKQYGVSKRISSALKRMSIQLKAPDKNVSDSFKFLNLILPSSDAYMMSVRYSLKTLSKTTSTVMGSIIAVTKISKEVEERLQELSNISDALQFKNNIIKYKPEEELNEGFFNRLSDDVSYFMVVRHTIDTHIRYIEELNQYNSRGSHNFRNEFY